MTMQMPDGRKTAGDTWRNSAQSFFQDLNSPELITPEISFLEKRELWDMFLEDLKQDATLGTDQQKQIIGKVYGLQHTGFGQTVTNPFSDIKNQKLMCQGTQTPQYNLSDEELNQAVENLIPKHAFYDMYNLFVTPNADMKIKNAEESLRWKERLLINANNPYLKVITENVPAYSYIVGSEIVRTLVERGVKLDEDMDQTSQKDLQRALGDATAQAQEKMEKLDDMAEGLGAGKVDSELTFEDMITLSEYYKLLKDVPLEDKFLKDFIKNTLKLSKSYFSSRYKENEESMFEVDQLEDLEGLENLISPLDTINLTELVTHDRLYHTKVNVYIDRSGSMGGGHDVRSTFGGQHLNTLGMAKITGLKLQAMGEVGKIRAFDNDVHETPLTVRDMLFMTSGGGTTIDRVIDHVIKCKEPALILTDMEDSINVYSPDVYFIGVDDARFSGFRGDVGKQYIQNGQCVKYTKDNKFIKITESNKNTA